MTKSDAKTEIRLAEIQIKQAEYWLKVAEQRKKNAESELEKLERVDYSRWIGNHTGWFAIKGNRYLKYKGTTETIQYDDNARGCYNDTFSHIDITVSELKYGDCVCFYPEKKENELELMDFGLFIGFNNSRTPIFQVLNVCYELERITNLPRSVDDTVRKFIK